ncbi:uncharacterized protein METZ01_LOCUS275648 [marine metagenome]|uniref:Uncharacterized protein n=1 Tax=marine metagenome TaxID=408172 RepID=A0A382KCT3_9ZZZZ
MSKAETAPRLQDLAYQDLPIAAWCLTCGHHKLMPVAPLLARIDGRTAVTSLAFRLTCSACGGQSIETRPNYAGLGIVAGHRWHRN